MRIYVILKNISCCTYRLPRGCTAIDIQKLNTKRFPEQKNLTKDDYLIVCGDFGLVWDESPEERYWRKWLDDKPFTTLWIDGNHENFELLKEFPVINKFGG